MFALALATLAILPLPDVAEDYCYRIELNHFYDEDGRPVFSQVIFWDERHVIAWRNWRVPEQTPWLDRRRGGYVTQWLDGDKFRVVRAAHYNESWTQHDPELVDRDARPAFARRLLKDEFPPQPPQPILIQGE